MSSCDDKASTQPPAAAAAASSPQPERPGPAPPAATSGLAGFPRSTRSMLRQPNRRLGDRRTAPSRCPSAAGHLRMLNNTNLCDPPGMRRDRAPASMRLCRYRFTAMRPNPATTRRRIHHTRTHAGAAVRCCVPSTRSGERGPGVLTAAVEILRREPGPARDRGTERENGLTFDLERCAKHGVS